MTIFGVTGHRQAPARVWQELPDALAALFRDAEPLIGVSSLAPGADQVFATSILRAGGALHAVIPCVGYETSLTPSDRSRYLDLVCRAQSIEVMPFSVAGGDAYLAAGERVIALSDVLVAIWDGASAWGKGGTGDAVAHARECGVPVQVIWPVGLRRSPAHDVAAPVP